MQHTHDTIDSVTDHKVDHIKALIVSNSDTSVDHVKKMSGDKDIEVAASVSLHEYTTSCPSITDSKVQGTGCVPDSCKSSSSTHRSNMLTLTAVGTTDNDETSVINETADDQNIDTPGMIASKVQEHDDESVRTSHSVDKPIGTSVLTDYNGSRNQSITNVDMTQDKHSVDSYSSIDTNGETYPAVTLATDHTGWKTWSNHQVTNRSAFVFNYSVCVCVCVCVCVTVFGVLCRFLTIVQ